MLLHATALLQNALNGPSAWDRRETEAQGWMDRDPLCTAPQCQELSLESHWTLVCQALPSGQWRHLLEDLFTCQTLQGYLLGAKPCSSHSGHTVSWNLQYHFGGASGRGVLAPSFQSLKSEGGNGRTPAFHSQWRVKQTQGYPAHRCPQQHCSQEPKGVNKPHANYLMGGINQTWYFHPAEYYSALKSTVFPFGAMNMIGCWTETMIAWYCDCTKCRWIVYFKMVSV